MFNYKSEVKGKAGIIARVVAKSKSSTTKTITTYELEYPRFIHSELMTHRMFSRNAASSRAIPVKKTIEQVRLAPAMPVHWGKNQAGMQAKEELVGKALDDAKLWWNLAASNAANCAEDLDRRCGAHKQIANRVLEPFVFMKTVLTTTEEANWYYLRDHEDADPTIAELAKCMWQATALVEAEELQPGDWHVPYYLDGYWKDSGYAGKEMKPLFNKRDNESTLENALAVSSSCCAQVSFRLLDDSLEKADKIYDRLVNSKPVHASPFEHSATPMEDLYFEHVGADAVNVPFDPDSWQEGITHVDKNGKLWSGNFEGFIQYRQLIPGNVVLG